MFRYTYIDVVRLSLIMLSLMLAGCGGLSLPVTQSSTELEGPPPSPTLAAEDPASKIDKVLNSLTERDRKSTRLNSSHGYQSRMPSSA